MNTKPVSTGYSICSNGIPWFKKCATFLCHGSPDSSRGRYVRTKDDIHFYFQYSTLLTPHIVSFGVSHTCRLSDKANPSLTKGILINRQFVTATPGRNSSYLER